MDTKLRDDFQKDYERFFPGADLPLIFYYTDEDERARTVSTVSEHRCFVCDLGRVRKGMPMQFGIEALSCGGARRYLGFSHEQELDFEDFLACGTPDGREGIRYKKTPELVRNIMQKQPGFDAPGRFIVFKRWDRIRPEDKPEAVIFFATPDILSGLFTVANFDESDPNAVIAPSCAGCSAIVYYPYVEARRERPRCVLGMFDTSARQCVKPDILTFSVPWPKFVRMARDFPVSNLITDTWDRVRRRIARVDVP